jgi:hypothetical protein
MNPIVDLLREMRGRLPMYLGSNSLAKLATFLRGYAYALEKQGIHPQADFLSALQDSVEARYPVNVSRSWEAILLFHSVDDNEAIDLFWRIFDDLCAQGNAREKLAS